MPSIHENYFIIIIVFACSLEALSSFDFFTSLNYLAFLAHR